MTAYWHRSGIRNDLGDRGSIWGEKADEFFGVLTPAAARPAYYANAAQSALSRQAVRRLQRFTKRPLQPAGRTKARCLKAE